MPGLLDVAVDGIVPEGGGYPFLTDWALLPPERLRTSSARFYFSTWAAALPEARELLMVVRRAGVIVGAQDLRARDFRVARVAATGSWLGRRFHGCGTGTLMRQMMSPSQSRSPVRGSRRCDGSSGSTTRRALNKV